MPKNHDYFMNIARSVTENNRMCPSRKFGAVLVDENWHIIGTGFNGAPKGVDHPEDRLFRYINDKGDELVVVGCGWQYIEIPKDTEPSIIPSLHGPTGFYRLKRAKDLVDVKISKFEDLIFVNENNDQLGEFYTRYIVRPVDENNQIIEDYINHQRLYKKRDNGTYEFVKIFNQPICPRRAFDIPSGQRLEMCGCQHAECNTINSCAESGTSTRGATLYLWADRNPSPPCIGCTGAIINAGIKRVVCQKSDSGDYSKDSRNFFQQAGTELIEIDFPSNE